jgi:hypothetical protein
LPAALTPGIDEHSTEELNPMSLRQNIKILSLLAALLAFFAVAAVGAQAKAPGWTTKINGVEATMTAGQERAATITNTGTVTLGFSGLTLKSTTTGDCHSAAKIIGTAAGAPGTLTVDNLICKNTEITGAAGCIVNSPGSPAGTIVTVALTGTLVWLQQAQANDETGITITSESVTNGPLATLEFSGATCPLVGQKLIKSGSFICKVTKGLTEHTATGEFECKDNPPIETYYTNATPGGRVKVEGQDKMKVGNAAATFGGVFHITPTEANVLVGIEPH